jgi:nucleoside-diphosphate-sugar epimerase
MTGTVSENAPIRPIGVYESTKAASDELVLEAAERGYLQSVTILRPSNVFGVTMRNRSLMQMVRLIESGWFVFIGRPGASANYVEVTNVINALTLCATRPDASGRTYLVSDWCTMEDFVGAICRGLHRPMPSLRLSERPVRWLAKSLQRFGRALLTERRVDALVGRATYSTRLIETELGYRRAVCVTDGIRDCAQAWSKSTRFGSKPPSLLESDALAGDHPDRN